MIDLNKDVDPLWPAPAPEGHRAGDDRRTDAPSTPPAASSTDHPGRATRKPPRIPGRTRL